ncbi:MAG: hypothetical protein HY718_03375 [Planctomycetes bacterium]|nr:hypothetical protein [Planctomycetota bacterium]
MEASMKRAAAGPRKVTPTARSGQQGARYRQPSRWLVGVALLAMVGCKQQGGTAPKREGQTARLTPRTVPYLTGVAVPSGFSMNKRGSDTRESGGVRFARHEYAGYADPHAIQEFYKEQMPLMGWREISAQEVKGRISIRFESGNEECTVMIEPIVFFSRTEIQVIVNPFNRNPSEPPPRRPMP